MYTLTIASLKSNSGFEPSWAENCFISASRCSVSARFSSSSMSFCTEPSRAAVEGRRDPLGEQLVAGLERPAEPLAQLRRLTLELRPHVVGLGGGALALEHPGADLDRVAHRLGGRVAGLGALADELRGAGVLDRQRLDHEPVVERADGAVGPVVEGELWSFGCFHGNLSR